MRALAPNKPQSIQAQDSLLIPKIRVLAALGLVGGVGGMLTLTFTVTRHPGRAVMMIPRLIDWNCQHNR